YQDPEQGLVIYAPKILKLNNNNSEKVFWFTYWISTDKTKGRLKWGQGPPVLEEDVLEELLKQGIKQNLFSSHFLERLRAEIDSILEK
ncbi:MAG: hypothetical protein PHU23_19080, partial [Dehalococcoidales bacterium]|nr:hypothetical protein [Dehalococcoidales bacterium]